MPTIVHFEVPADEVERAKGFYEGLFGWKIEPMEGMDYWVIKTGHESGPGGGMMLRQEPNQGITNYIDVAAVDDFTAKVQELGGKILVSKTAVPGMGYFAVCLDTEGNRFGLWESDQNAQ